MLRSFARQNELLNRTIAVHITKMNVSRCCPRLKDLGGLTANTVIVVVSALEPVSRHVSSEGGWIRIFGSNVGNDDVGFHIQIVVENGGVGEGDQSVVRIAVPSICPTVFKRTVAGRR